MYNLTFDFDLFLSAKSHIHLHVQFIFFHNGFYFEHKCNVVCNGWHLPKFYNKFYTDNFKERQYRVIIWEGPCNWLISSTSQM